MPDKYICKVSFIFFMKIYLLARQRISINITIRIFFYYLNPQFEDPRGFVAPEYENVKIKDTGMYYIFKDAFL